jgi:stalled ribosome rescue protein Dom34
MKTAVGLWIDHRQAVIVAISGNAEHIQRISSNVERYHRQSGTSGPADDARQRELTEHLNSYYEEVVTRIRDAESILIFGPGEAKGELKARLEKDKLGGRVVGIETSDKMTDPQIVAKVRGYYLDQGAATSSR